MNNELNAIVIAPNDSVAVAIQPLSAGDRARFKVNDKVTEVEVVQDIPIYHKLALVDIPAGETVYKYGQSIGRAITNIAVGQHVHTHNLVSVREAIEE